MNHPTPTVLVTDLTILASEAFSKEEENDNFLHFVQRQDPVWLDNIVHKTNAKMSSAIDCTQCGNCCKNLMVNITEQEIAGLAVFLNTDVKTVKDQYIEESLAGNYIINTIPCTFLSEKKCTIYANRFTECREFPHLHKNGFKERLLGTLLHYGSCPIIYNVIEAVKKETGFLLPD